MIVRYSLTRLLVAAALSVGAGSALAESLIVYSPQGGDRSVWIAEQAKAAGHDIQILNAGGGELFDRLIAEKNNPQADVVFGLVDTSMALLKTEGLFQAYVPKWTEGLPDQYKGPDGMIHKFWQTPIVLAFNADKLADTDAPKGWLDLTNDAFKGKYVIGSSNWQTTRIYLAGILTRFTGENGDVSEEGWDFMRKLYANAIIVNDGEAKKQVYISGDATIDLNWFGGAFRQAENVGYTVKLIDTAGGTPFISEGIAIMKGTDRLDAAKAFVDWFGSPEFMGAYAEKFGQAQSIRQRWKCRLPRSRKTPNWSRPSRSIGTRWPASWTAGCRRSSSRSARRSIRTDESGNWWIFVWKQRTTTKG